MHNNIIDIHNGDKYTPIRRFYARIGFYTVLAIVPFSIIQVYAYLTIINAVVANTCR